MPYLLCGTWSFSYNLFLLGSKHIIVRMWGCKVKFVGDHGDEFRVEGGVRSDKFHVLIEEDDFDGFWTKFYSRS